MTTQENIRNMCIIAHVDHGKSSISDTLMAAGGLISFDEAGVKRVTDTRADEKERGITIKSTGVALRIKHEDKMYNINLIDTPGHIDFSSEVTAAIRITDGAIVLVDSVEGCSAQTETVLRQALAEKSQVILVINKIDRYFTELQLSGEVAYQKLQSIINQINGMIDTYQPDNPTRMNPQNGNVFFTCARYNWGFSIKSMAQLYANKAGKPYESYMKLLWGETFYNESTKKFSKVLTDGTRGFCHFIYNPLQEAITTIMNKSNDEDKLKNAFLTLLPSDLNLVEPKEILKKVLQRTHPLAPIVVEGIVKYLPSPLVAQKHKVDVIYTGPSGSTTYESIKNCDPSGPLVIYISKMVPNDTGNFYAFGRVFSGTVHAGQKVDVLNANYEHGGKTDIFAGVSIQRVVSLVGAKIEAVDSIQCGNTVALVGVDKYMVKSGTLTTCPERYPIKTMKFTVSPIVRVAVAPKNMADLPKFKEGIIRLSKSDPCLKVELDEEGCYIIAGAGELHVEIAINDLKGFLDTVEVKVSKPVVPYRETITTESTVMCLSKSPNKHNRLYMKAEPLAPEIVRELEAKEELGEGYSLRDHVTLTKMLVQHGWEKDVAAKIWAVKGCNFLVDATRGVQYLNEIRDSVTTGFDIVVDKGPLCGEPVRGVVFKLYDVTLHADAIHRGAGQIMPCATRVMFASLLTANPRLVEPYYSVDIQVDDPNKSRLYSIMTRKRGMITGEQNVDGTLLWNMQAIFPVAESFGFDAFVKQETSGKALCSCKFSHWEMVESDPMVIATDPTKCDANRIVMDIQKRKAEGRPNAKVELPKFEDYLDKL